MSNETKAPAGMTLVIGRRKFPVESLAHASARYQQFRGAKSSRVIGGGEVFSSAGGHLAHVSYNGRVWPPAPWRPGPGATEPLLEADAPEVLAAARASARAVPQ